MGAVVGAASLLLHLGQQRCWGQDWVLQWVNRCRRMGQLAASEGDFSQHGDSLLTRAAETHHPPGASQDLHVCLHGITATHMKGSTANGLEDQGRDELPALCHPAEPLSTADRSLLRINSAAQQIRGCCIHILQPRSPARALPSLYETPVRCCPASVMLLREERGECIPPRVTLQLACSRGARS